MSRKYHVTASIEINKTTFTSAPVSLSVCSPEIQLLESYFSTYQIVNSIFIESRCYTGKALFLRNSFNNPIVGSVSSIPFELEKMPEAIAVVENTVIDVTGQWVCWQDRTSITAALGHLYSKFEFYNSTKVDYYRFVVIRRIDSTQKNSNRDFVEYDGLFDVRLQKEIIPAAYDDIEVIDTVRQLMEINNIDDTNGIANV